jgi:hypothetical protein
MSKAAFNADTLRLFAADLRDALLLSGFSDATVMLGRSATGSYVVRKAADQPHLNSALAEQVRRQILLRQKLSTAVRVPEVLHEGYREDRYFFDMEFIPSRAASVYLATCRLSEVAEFADAIERLMDGMANQAALSSTPIPPSTAAITAKLDQINDRTAGRFRKLLAPLAAVAEHALDSLPSGDCSAAHGDLTFENVLVDHSGALCLIDPIPSPFDHYWMDWSKLFQDCEGEWFLHRGQRIEPGICHWLRDRLFAQATGRSPGYASWHYLLLSLTFARILPYTRTESDSMFVSTRVQRFSELAMQNVGRSI